MIRPEKSVAVWLIWLATTAVAVLVAWLAMRPVLAAAIPDEGLPIPISEVYGEPSLLPTDSATRRSEPRTLDGWYEIKKGVWEQGFHTGGGSVTVRASAAEVKLISATPADGYAVIVDDRAKGHVVVRFHHGDTVYTVDAMWWNGGPYAAVEESG